MPILTNFPLVAAMAAIFITQVTKIPVAYFIHNRWNIQLMFSTGGMPSSHSAGVTALITAIIIEHGWESPLTAISMTFGILVMFDSMGVRRQSGEHGIIINELISEIHSLTRPATASDNPSSSMQSTEFLGHKPIEVVLGLIYGILLATLIYFMFYK